jgi:hypothetical protein
VNAWKGEDLAPIGAQMGVALRFMDRLVALTQAEREAVRMPEDPEAYAGAAGSVQVQLEAALREERDTPPHPTGGLQAFAWRADRHLDELGITGDLWDLARGAIQAILVWTRPGAQTPARILYAPFEHLIPYASLHG